MLANWVLRRLSHPGSLSAQARRLSGCHIAAQIASNVAYPVLRSGAGVWCVMEYPEVGNKRISSLLDKLVPGGDSFIFPSYLTVERRICRIAGCVLARIIQGESVEYMLPSSRPSRAMRSLYDLAGLPTEITGPLFVLMLILCLTPYFSGSDFGIFKIPDIPPHAKRRWRIWGPIALLIVLAGFFPLVPRPVQAIPQEPIQSDQDLAKIASEIKTTELQLRKLSSIDQELEAIRKLKDLYGEAKGSFWPDKADQLNSECSAILARLKIYDLSEEEKQLVARADEAASATFFPEKIYVSVRALAESIDKRRNALQSDLEDLRAQEIELLRTRSGR